MSHQMRQSTLETIGLGSPLSIFKNGRMPVEAPEMVDKVFGTERDRGCMLISGANGIVGAGKLMQFSSRLERHGVIVAALDFPSSQDGIGRQYSGLEKAFGTEGARRIMSNVVRLAYDGKTPPPTLKKINPRFLLEAIPEMAEIKRAHYQVFRDAFPGIEIRSVTSGFPSSQLGVGIAHPAFPHESNKVFEVVEPIPSDITKLLWTLGLMPVPVKDSWSFVLDVIFCGLTLAGTRCRCASNMPYWKIDRHIRLLLGPKPFRAHDVIGASGANYLTWSCLHHLNLEYGGLFQPTPELSWHKDSGTGWYPQDHFRPVVDWHMDAIEEEEFRSRILGMLFHLANLVLWERRANPAIVNIIGELCAQFRSGILALIRKSGPDEAIRLIEAFHRLEPLAAQTPCHPEVFAEIDSMEWRQLYVNAEHDGNFGVISIGRETYNWDIDTELNRAIDWLKHAGIENVIVSGDFHLAAQLAGADIAEFHQVLDDFSAVEHICLEWSRTARRFNDEFKTSLAFIGGKRCLGGFLELMMHCHYLIAVDDTELGMPELTLPVLPGMEGCHWPFRKTSPEKWPELLTLLFSGKPVKAGNAVGWLADFAGPMDAALKMAGSIARGESSLPRHHLETGRLPEIPLEYFPLPKSGGPADESAYKAMLEAIRSSCGVPLSEAIGIQARHSAGFMTGPCCRNGRIGMTKPQE